MSAHLELRDLLGPYVIGAFGPEEKNARSRSTSENARRAKTRFAASALHTNA